MATVTDPAPARQKAGWRPRVRYGIATVAGCVMLLGTAPAYAAHAQPRIFDGSPVPVPGWMGYVTVDFGGGTRGSCAGSAISRNVVLTAGHCIVNESTNTYVNPGQIGVVFGQDNPLGALRSGAARVDPVVNWSTPRSYGVYTSGELTNDIALLQLRDSAPAAIDLAAGDFGLGAIPLGGTIVGWGRTDDSDPNSVPPQLLAAGVPIQTDAVCSAYAAPHFDSRFMTCAGDGQHAAICKGDSGGPLLVADAAGNPLVAGVVSFEKGQCQLLGVPSTFARVAIPSPLGSFIDKYAPMLQAAAQAPSHRRHSPKKHRRHNRRHRRHHRRHRRHR